MELKDVFEVLGIEGEVTTREQLAQIFNATYVPIAKASDHPDVRKATEGRIFGEQYGRLAKLSGGKYTKEELSGMPFGEALEKFGTGLTAELESVRSKAKEGQSKQVTELQEQVTDLQKSIEDYKRDKKTLSEKLGQVEAESNTKVKTFVVGMKRKEVEARLPWKDGLTDLERAGLDSHIQSNYRLDAEDSGEVVVRDKEGHTIPSKKKAGEVLTLEDLYMEIGEKNNLFKKNNTSAGQGRHIAAQQAAPDKAAFTPRRLPPVNVVGQ